jgi:hypothetical protein
MESSILNSQNVCQLSNGTIINWCSSILNMWEYMNMVIPMLELPNSSNTCGCVSYVNCKP